MRGARGRAPRRRAAAHDEDRPVDRAEPTAPAPATPAPVAPPPALPAPTRFVATTGSDAGTCAAAAPCRSLDRAYHVAAPGEVVAGRRRRLRRPDDHAGPGQDRVGLRHRRAAWRACVAFTPAAGATVTMPSLELGATYGVPGPAGVAVVATADRRLRTGELTLNRPRELATWGISAGNLYVTGGEHVALRGGDVGGIVSPDGTHPEIQRVYHSSPLVVPTDLTIEGVRFHDITTTHPSAHTDCLQIENGDGIVLRGNRFERCGGTGPAHELGLGHAGGAADARPHRGQPLRRLRRHPGLAAVLLRGAGRTGIDVLVRNNTATMPLQLAGSAFYARNVRYVGNLAPGMDCEGLRDLRPQRLDAGDVRPDAIAASPRSASSTPLTATCAPGRARRRSTPATPRASPPRTSPGRRGRAEPRPDAGAYEIR